MKSLLSIVAICILSFSATLSAQQQYTINGKEYTLLTEVDGPLTLLWNTIDGDFRYFAKKDNTISELKNTKQDGKYQEEYKRELQTLTADAPVKSDNINLTLPSLKDFFDAYNKRRDANYTAIDKKIKLSTRLGAFAGVTNSIFTDNPTNAFQPIAGADLEILDNIKLRRHALVMRFKHTFETNDFVFSSSQLSLNYRFKFIQTPRFDAYIQAKFVSYTYVKREVLVTTPSIMTVQQSGGDFTAPGIFGIGADYKLGNGYVTFNYNDIVAIGESSNGEFPTELTLGYKFNL